ncbi:MAG: hypothetical protein V4505_10395 [Pseudomonadota bacterium]
MTAPLPIDNSGESLQGHADDDVSVDHIVREGPAGAIAVAGVATLLVVALVVAFYVFVYLPRGVLQ